MAISEKLFAILKLKATYEYVDAHIGTPYVHPATHSADIITDGSTNKAYTATEKTKLAGIAIGATAYVHPATHSADIITDGTTNKAYTAAEKTKLASVLNADGNYVVNDTRSVATPTDIGDPGVRFDFKSNAIDGLADGGVYHGVMTLQQWTDGSGGTIHQLGMTDNNNFYVRTAPIAGAWSAWQKLWHSGNDGAGSGLDADVLNGYGPSTAAVANSIVRRDANNYIYGKYFNSDRPDEPTAAASYLFDSGDGWMRKKTLANARNELALGAYPVGSIYMSVSPTNPGSLFGGTWVTFANGRTLVGWYSADPDFDAAEDYGGDKVVTLTAAQIPGNSVNIYTGATGGALGGGALAYAGTRSGSAYGTNGGGLSHNNMPPYMVVYMWKRTA